MLLLRVSRLRVISAAALLLCCFPPPQRCPAAENKTPDTMHNNIHKKLSSLLTWSVCYARLQGF